MEINTHTIRTNYELIDMINFIVEKKDSYTFWHIKRVAFYAVKIAEKLCVDEVTLMKVHQASLLHDIGKLITPESILLKPKRLTRKEFKIIQEHVSDGVAILEKVKSFKDLIPYVRHHHERYDGHGYPDQLKAEEIPFISRIITVADAFDAMTTERIYKPKKNIDEAIRELQQCSGTQFDPIIVNAAIEFLKNHHTFKQVAQMPKSILEEERFAFYFKDKITSAYSSEYLNYFLQKHVQENYTYAYLIETRSLSAFNLEFGWKAGNKLLKELVSRLKLLFHSTMVFRVFGDDFVLMSQDPLPSNLTILSHKLSVGFSPASITITSFLLKDFSLNVWEDFEPYLQKYHHPKEL